MTEEDKTPADMPPTADELPAEIRALRLRAELTALRNRFDEMNDLGAAIMADREAQGALSYLREFASNIENYETISHIVMFDKIGIKAAAKDQDWDCVEEHKRSLLRGTELMEKAQAAAAKAQEDLGAHLRGCQFLKVPDPADLPEVERLSKEALFDTGEQRVDANRRLGEFQTTYNQKVAQYQALLEQIKASREPGPNQPR